jgi:23S rRNA U2552 (ribose-2'-O)-methylase RlmE/FtsJ
MIHFQIPRNHIHLYENIDCSFLEFVTPPPGFNPIDSSMKPVCSNSLSNYLYDIKERIHLYEKEWDIYKRYTNPYEYIHTPVPTSYINGNVEFNASKSFSTKHRYSTKSISKYKPLSRSYFKMIEITNFFRLLDKKNTSIKGSDIPIISFHLAEGPGGFIEALVNMRVNKSDKYIGITILDDIYDQNIPAWKKSEYFLNENPNVFIETGADKTGDILSIANFDYCVKKYESSIDIITGDGGFDFSIDFNSQEINISRLLFAQVAYALCLQRHKGSFILKIFDCFMNHTLDILAILSSFYEKVYITKPQTSRYANSEKYIVCKGFLFTTSSTFLPFIRSTFEKMMDPININKDLLRFLTIPLSNYFVTRIEELNAIFGQQQIENIHYTISLIDCKTRGEKLNAIIKTNIEKCTTWCTKHNC